MFSASDRRYPVELPFAWREADQLRIELPAGYQFDNADSPGSLSFGEVGGYTLVMKTENSPALHLVVTRELKFGANGGIAFPLSSYPTLKKIFDEVRLRDTHTLSLKAN